MVKGNYVVVRFTVWAQFRIVQQILGVLHPLASFYHEIRHAHYAQNNVFIESAFLSKKISLIMGVHTIHKFMLYLQSYGIYVTLNMRNQGLCEIPECFCECVFPVSLNFGLQCLINHFIHMKVLECTNGDASQWFCTKVSWVPYIYRQILWNQMYSSLSSEVQHWALGTKFRLNTWSFGIKFCEFLRNTCGILIIQ